LLLLVVALLGTFVLAAAGCGGGNESSGGGTGSGGGQTGTAANQTMTIAWGAEPPSLDPGLATDTTSANVLLNMTNAGTPDRQEARRLLELVGLADRRDRLPPELSGGEQQRVALAVALAAKPPVLLADEPTGSLDATSSHQVMTLLQQVSRELSMTVLLVTHDLNMTNYATRTVRIRDGKVAAEATRGTEELAVLDSAGRVQLPQPLLAATGISRLAVVEVHGSTIVLRAPAQPEEGSES
jgi:energy-coupling factor transporter ATP-binding protein EcfA2